MTKRNTSNLVLRLPVGLALMSQISKEITSE